ncbi:MAG TPA: glycosyltransferase family 39 protein [Aggregatilineales bacterium]|nr:glycosyltransferase family 39 protein [Aggregatilineales bacterium]
MMRRAPVLILGAIVLAYLFIATLYAVKTPAWQVPDEPAHYNYVRQVASGGCCPVMAPGDWDNDYLNAIKAAKFSPAALGTRLSTIQYENQQPPLFYFLEAPVYSLSEGNLTALRLFSVLLGAGIIIVAWALVRIVFPAQPTLALTTAAFVAFLPQHVAMMAGVDNDSLAELVVALSLLACVLYLKQPPIPRPLASTQAEGKGRNPDLDAPRPFTGEGLGVRDGIHPILLGLLLGIAFLTKITAMAPIIALIGVAVIVRAQRDSWTLQRFIREAAWIALPALALGLPLWLRNVNTYGGLDILAQSAHDRVVVGQPTRQDYIDQHGFGGWIKDAIGTSFDSFWGQFGWLGVPMTLPIYLALLAFSLLVLVGAGIAFVRWRRMLSPPQRDALMLFGITALLALAGLVYWNLKYVQFQGRYLYPGLIPIALFVAIGLAGWASLLKTRAALWLTTGVVCLFAVLDLYVLFRIIMPALAL